MKKIFIVLLLLAACASVQYKPVEVADLKEVIERVEKDESIPEDKKNYYLSEFKQAQRGLQNQSTYIVELETDRAKKQEEIDKLKSKIESLSESKGRVKQMDYQFWGFIGLCILALIGVVLYILIKFGNIFSPAKAPSLATELIKKQVGL
jgi:hypothetical protein